MRRLRQIHHWLGAFFAPAILFFTVTGALQTFSLHESKGGGDYKPPKWIVVAASIHKDQPLPHPRPHREKPKPAAAPLGAPAPDADHDDDHDHAHAAPAAGAPKAAAMQPGGEEHAEHHERGPSPLPLKIFFLIVALSLFYSTCSGIYMAYKYTRRPLAISVLLILGVVIPTLMVLV